MQLLQTGKMEESFFNKTLINQGSLNKESLEELNALIKEYPYFSTLWSLYLKNLHVLKHPKFTEELGDNAIKIADRKKFYNEIKHGKIQELFGFIGLSSEEYKLEDVDFNENTFTDEKNSLIDLFVKSSQKIEIKSDLELTVNGDEILKESQDIKDDMITETYVNILVEQKKYKKAIDGFKKLSLKYPEKNSYFAARIDEIEKLKNN